MTTGSIKGAHLDVSNAALQLGVSPAVDFEREEGLEESQKMYPPRSPPNLIDTDKCSLLPPPMSPERVWSI